MTRVNRSLMPRIVDSRSAEMGWRKRGRFIVRAREVLQVDGLRGKLNTTPFPEHPRLLGRSRTYTAADLSARLRRWHAPRIDRWEQLRVTAGTLGIEYLCAGGVMCARLVAGQQRWIAPGTRWRVAHMGVADRFEIGVHADSKGQAEAPQPLRSDLLLHATRVAVATADALAALVQSLAAGERCIVEARFSLAAVPALRLQDRPLSWHPLEATERGFTALIALALAPFGLATYLALDHAVIEAALGGALAGNAESAGWLRATLERHLDIEEEVVFPTYVDAGGDARLVRGLLNEHHYLRQYLGELDQPPSRRKFLRLLDGHDEKEESVVYPDILQRLGERADMLLTEAIARAPGREGCGQTPSRPAGACL